MLSQFNIVIRDAFNLIIDMGKDTVQLTEPIARLFQGKNFAFVSTLMKDGSPQITPTWVDIEKNNEYSILVNTAEGRIKHKNLSRDPRLAISVINGGNPYEMVTIQGKVIEQITRDAADEHIDKLAKKYLDLDKYPGRSPGEKRVILKIKPEKIFYHDFSH
jgi:PPOX class probable F420-dependent enzyme